MQNAFRIDFETYSEANIKKVGAYRYAADPSTEILIMAISRASGGDLPVVWDCVDGGVEAIGLLREAIKTGAPIYAFNAQFEAATCKYLLKKTFGLEPPKLEQWRCSAAMARRAAIPSNLDQCGAFLGINRPKDKEGSRLINKFSKLRKPTKKDPRTRIRPEDDPEDFARFVDYCRRDVEAEADVAQALAAFELEGDTLAAFQFDLRMNDRGVPVNVAALRHTQGLIEEYETRLAGQFKEITGLKHTQREKVLGWLRDGGYPGTDLTANTVDEVLANGPRGWETRFVERARELAGEDWVEAEAAAADVESRDIKPLPRRFTEKKLQPVNMADEAFEALRLRSLVSYAAVKKVATMLAAACPDGRVRGALLWSGAERTHRWAGKIIQPQNFRRPTIKDTKGAYGALCRGADIETIEMVWGPFLEVVASCIRHFIQEPKGEMLQADFSSVEARGAPWLCGGETKLEMFRNNAPIYETMAAKIFGRSVDSIGKESEERFIGKQAELGCTYNMGRPKFRGTCENYNYKPSPAMVAQYKIRYFRQLKAAREQAAIEEPVDRFEKTPGMAFEITNDIKLEVFIGRVLKVWAYRKGGARRLVVDPDHPTPEEWDDLTFDDLADRAVTAWREDNPEIVKAWRSLDAAAKDAIRNPGEVFWGTDKISFGVTSRPGFKALVMKLPSGHCLIYPKVKLVWKGDEDDDPDEEKDWSNNFKTEIKFWGKIPMKSTWGWCKTYGGKLLENATQAICGDFMAHGARVAEQNKYLALMLVHDELIGPKAPDQDWQTLCQHLCTLPDWAEGMPLAADGKQIPFYLK